VAGRIRELERFAVSIGKGIREWVELKIACKDESSNDVWRCNEGMGGGVGIVTSSEVTVVGGDGRVDVALLDVLPIPLSNVRTAGVSEDQAANTLESLDLSVTGNCNTDLLGTGVIVNFDLMLKS